MTELIHGPDRLRDSGLLDELLVKCLDALLIEDVLDDMERGRALGDTGVGRRVETDRGLITDMDCGLDDWPGPGRALLVAVAALCLLDMEVGRDMALGRGDVDPCLIDTEAGLLDAVLGLLEAEAGREMEVGLLDIEPGLLELKTGATFVADLVMLVGRVLPCTRLFEQVMAVSPLLLKAGRAIGGALLGLPRGNSVAMTGGEYRPPTPCPTSLLVFNALIGLLTSIADAAPNPAPTPNPTAATPNPATIPVPDPAPDPDHAPDPVPDERMDWLPSDETCNFLARGLAPEKDSGLLEGNSRAEDSPTPFRACEDATAGGVRLLGGDLRSGVMLLGGVREFLRGLTCPDVPRDTESRSSS